MATDREQRVGAGSNPGSGVARVTHVARPKDVDRLSDGISPTVATKVEWSDQSSFMSLRELIVVSSKLSLPV